MKQKFCFAKTLKILQRRRFRNKKIFYISWGDFTFKVIRKIIIFWTSGAIFIIFSDSDPEFFSESNEPRLANIEDREFFRLYKFYKMGVRIFDINLKIIKTSDSRCYQPVQKVWIYRNRFWKFIFVICRLHNVIKQHRTA